MTAVRHLMDSMSDEEETGAIHQVDTVPPPDGEDDAYNAATKVGPMAGAFVAELMAQSDEQDAIDVSLSTPTSGVRTLSFPKTPSILSGIPMSAPPALPRLSERDDPARPIEKTVLLAAPDSARLDRRLMESAMAEAQSRAAAAQAQASLAPLACEPAAWSAPTVAAAPAPPADLAPLLEPAPAASPAVDEEVESGPSIGLEAAIFILSFLAVAVPAVYICLRWM